MSFEPIENYGVIGNMRSIALVGVNGSIDFLCYPNFDSPTVFAALLDDERGGCFQIEPQLKEKRARQLYLPDTNILLTRFLAEEGVAELTDYMPIEADGKQPNEIIRTLAVIRGEVDFKMRCQPRFDYGRCGHTASIEDRYATVLRDAIHEFFRHRAETHRQRLRELFRLGRSSLLIGLVALAGAIALGDFLATLMKGSRIGEIVRESLTIGGWVSMWRPLEVFLYDWWPIRNEARLSDRLAAMPVRIRYANATAPDAWRGDWPAVSPRGERKAEAPQGTLNLAS